MIIRWTKPAAGDLTRICDFTLDRFGQAQGRKTAVALYECVESLSRFPLRGRIGRKPATRELVISGYPFVAIYRVRDNSIEILRILHGAQKWP